MSTIHFSRRPYTVTYYKEGERHTIRRTPPPKLHEIWPDDVVSLKTTKNADYLEGDEFTVKHINTRHPNVIQIENEDGDRTFVPSYDLELEDKVGVRYGIDPKKGTTYNRYLLWP